MIWISKNRCVGCGLCVESCPVKAISIEKGIAVIDKNKCINCGNCINSCPQGAVKDIKEELVIAIGTDDGETIKSGDHVGMSKYYLIFECSKGNLDFKEKRENIKYLEDETKIHGDPEKAKKVTSVLKDIDVLVGERFGPNIVRLRNSFVCAVVREQKIENTLEKIKDNIIEIIDEKNKDDRNGIILR